MKSRKTDARNASEVFEEFLKTYKLNSKFKETYLVTYWEKIMGSSIAFRTEKIYINKRRLFLKISSSPLRQELVLAKSKIISVLNREIGEDLIDDIIFI